MPVITGEFPLVPAIYFWIAFSRRERRGCVPFTGPRERRNRRADSWDKPNLCLSLDRRIQPPRLEGPVSFDCAAGVAGGAPAVSLESVDVEGGGGWASPSVATSFVLNARRAGRRCCRSSRYRRPA